MCGIIGAFPACKLDIGWIRHRGPDAQGEFGDAKIAFGHARLSILDLSERGSQPCWSRDGKTLLAYNGEIYNHASLDGADARSDTLTLLERLRRTGATYDPGELDGMYAFGAWFPATSTLLLARDPAGIKPLFIAISRNGESMAFSSELKGFLGIEWFSCAPNRDRRVQHQFLQNGYAAVSPCEVRWRGKTTTLRLVPTLLEGVWQIPPGGILELGETFLRERSVRIRTPTPGGDPLSESVRAQLMSDVKVGVQISGGIDSSLVAMEYALSGAAVDGFYVSVRHPGCDEDVWVETAAEAIRSKGDFQLHRIEVTESSFLDTLDDVVWYMDEPTIRHPNASGVFQLCKYVRERTSVKVLLTGEGADEIFAGYSWHDGRSMDGYDRSRRIFDLGEISELSPWLQSTGGSLLERQLGYDRALYLPPILARQDRMSMAHGIEARVPFLSNAFLSLPAPLVSGKTMLKRRAARIFGRAFAERPKSGFGFPLPWLGAVAWEPGDLDWMDRVPRPTNDFQSWSLAALSKWSRLFLADGWRARKPPATETPTIVRIQSETPTLAANVKMDQPPLDSCESPVEIIGAEGQMIVARTGGNEWKLDPTMYVDGEILRHGVFERESIRWLPQVVRKGARILDVGANFGYYSVLLANLAGPDGTICAFEPSERFRVRLADHVSRNRLGNVRVYPWGLSNRKERLELFGGGDSATLVWHDDAIAPSHTEWIELARLDDVWPELGLDRLDFVKVDIDGAEPFFLEGAARTLAKHRPAMLVEFMEMALIRSGFSVRDLLVQLDSMDYLVLPESSGKPWPSAAAFLREAANCSHSINVFALPKPPDDPELRHQHELVAKLPGMGSSRSSTAGKGSNSLRSLQGIAG